MTILLDQAFQKAQTLPPDAQDGIARIVMELTGDQPTYTLTPEEAVAMDEADADVERGNFATDQEVRAVLSKHGL
jgi:hypothetical protein